MKFIRVIDNGSGKSAEELQKIEDAINHILGESPELKEQLDERIHEFSSQLFGIPTFKSVKKDGFPEPFDSKYHQLGMAELLGYGKPLFSASHPSDINAPELESELSDDSLETFEYDDELDSIKPD